MHRTAILTILVVFGIPDMYAQDSLSRPVGFLSSSDTSFPQDADAHWTTPALENHSNPADERKSMSVALGLSLIVPGSGQVYNGEVLKGGVFFVLFAGGVVAIDAARITRAHESITAYGWMSVVYVTAVYLWNILDAPLSAKRINGEKDARQISLGSWPGEEAASPCPGAFPQNVIIRLRLGL